MKPGPMVTGSCKGSGRASFISGRRVPNQQTALLLWRVKGDGYWNRSLAHGILVLLTGFLRPQSSSCSKVNFASICTSETSSRPPWPEALPPSGSARYALVLVFCGSSLFVLMEQLLVMLRETQLPPSPVPQPRAAPVSQVPWGHPMSRASARASMGGLLSPMFLWMGKRSFCAPCSSSHLSKASAGQGEILFVGLWSMDTCENSSWRPVTLKPSGEVLWTVLGASKRLGRTPGGEI